MPLIRLLPLFLAPAFVLLASPVLGQGHSAPPTLSVTVAGSLDSAFVRARQSLATHGFRILAADSALHHLEVSSSTSTAVPVHIELTSAGDSSLLVLNAPGARSDVAALQALIEAADALKLSRNPKASLAPDGSNWPVDASGRVGYLVLTKKGAHWLKLHAGDTLPEVRPIHLPPTYRRTWESDIADAGFDAACARFFQAGSRYLVRYNMCHQPTPDDDRLDVYDADGDVWGVTIGETVQTYFAAQCPAARAPWPALGSEQRCPTPEE